MQDVHLSGVDLNLLAVLDALLSERNVTRAARRLGLTQPATSHALNRLRALFSDPLLVRGTGGMIPTPLAEQLAVPLRRGLLELQQVVQLDLGFEPARSTRAFAVATADYPQLTGLPRLLAHLSEEAPSVNLAIVPLGASLAARLESGELDLVLSGAETEENLGLDRRLMRTLIIRDSFVCATRHDHPGIRTGLDLETFVTWPHLLVSLTGRGSGIVDNALSSLGRSRRIAVRIPHFSGAPSLLARSNLIATLPKAMADYGTRLEQLRLFEPPLALPRAEVYLWWHERVQYDPAHAWFRAALLKAFGPYRL
jgi:DNA-binding transcriptional LysR family regulator